MKRVMFLYVVLIVIILAVAVIQSGSFDFDFSSSPQALINNKKINLILSKTPQEKTNGLSNREKLPDNNGMLFVFTLKDTHRFWMKDMKFPIDIIYINDDKIVDIFQNTQPPANPTDVTTVQIVTPNTPANYVLEVNSGTAQKYNFKVGDKVTLKNI